MSSRKLATSLLSHYFGWYFGIRSADIYDPYFASQIWIVIEYLSFDVSQRKIEIRSNF
jgi:hypothetical protein